MLKQVWHCAHLSLSLHAENSDAHQPLYPALCAISLTRPMSRRLSHIAMMVFAAFFLWMSHGVNIYHFCCTACEDYGRDIFLLASCEEVHDSHSCPDSGGCVCCTPKVNHDDCAAPSCMHFAPADDGGCGLLHYSIDIQHINNVHYNFYVPVCTVPDLLTFKAVSLSGHTVAAHFFSDIPLHDLSGRDLLSLVSTLLI